MKISKGSKVTIYVDPMTKTEIEGEATVVRRASNEDANGLQMVYVTFDADNGEGVWPRFIDSRGAFD